MKMKGAILECEECGHKWKIAPDTVKFQSSVPAFPAAGPASPPAPIASRIGGPKEQDVTVPLLVSVISGVLMALFMLVAEAKLRWALGGGLCTTSLVWLLTLLIFLASRAGLIQAFVWSIEDRFGVDIDGDGHEGEPESPGRTVIKPPPKRPRRWAKLDAASRLEDLVAFARRAYELREAGMGAGQKKFRGFGLPSRFKCADHIHAELMKDLVDASVAYYDGDSITFIDEIDSIHRLEHEIRQRVTVER